MSKNMVPYSLYLPADQREKLRELAKNRQGAELVRNAIEVMLTGGSEFDAGYNKAIEDLIKIVDSVKEIECIAVNGKYLNDLLAEKLRELRK
jgi:predicted DNA-binding protein